MNINIFLPEYINLDFISFQTINIFYVLAFLVWFFSIWYEGRRDGFDQERLLDLGFIVLFFKLSSFFMIKDYLQYLKIYDPYNLILSVDSTTLNIFIPFVVSSIVIIYFCKFLSWSKYRILDTYASTLSQSIFVLSLGYFLIYKINAFIPLIVLLPFIYLFILRLRSYKFISGATYSLFVLLAIPYILLFYRVQGYLYFILALATISIINFYIRWEKNDARTTSFGRVYKTVKRNPSRKARKAKKRNK